MSKGKDKGKTELEPLKTAEQKEDVPAINVQFIAELGDKLAKRERYEQLSGLEAVYYYLTQKHHWMPKRVRSMRLHDIYFCLKEERV
jgi:hypothetical protein